MKPEMFRVNWQSVKDHVCWIWYQNLHHTARYACSCHHTFFNCNFATKKNMKSENGAATKYIAESGRTFCTYVNSANVNWKEPNAKMENAKFKTAFHEKYLFPFLQVWYYSFSVSAVLQLFWPCVPTASSSIVSVLIQHPSIFATIPIYFLALQFYCGD